MPIGTLGEKGLHAALKVWYARPGDVIEKQVEGFHVDIARGELLIEIQTKNFSSQRRKLWKLASKHPVRLVFPIAQEKWIVRVAHDGTAQLGRRKSPKRGHLFQVFEELVSIPKMIENPNFSLEVLIIREEEIRSYDQGSRRRRGWSTVDHRLLEVLNRHVFKEPADFRALIPDGLPSPFQSADLAEGSRQPLWLAQKMTYCLRNMGVIERAGRKGNAILYHLA
jgi:hypothetical protein